jgi:hypothetical protein
VVGVRKFYDHEDRLTGWEPVILRNLGAGWEPVHTPFDRAVDMTADDFDILDYQGYLTWAESVAVRPTEVLIGDGFLGGGVTFDGTDWHWSEASMRDMTSAPDGQVYSTDAALLGHAHSVLVIQEDGSWRRLTSLENIGILSLYPLPGGVMLRGCILQKEGWFNWECVHPSAWYFGLDGAWKRLP